MDPVTPAVNGCSHSGRRSPVVTGLRAGTPGATDAYMTKLNLTVTMNIDLDALVRSLVRDLNEDALRLLISSIDATVGNRRFTSKLAEHFAAQKREYDRVAADEEKSEP